MKCIIMTALQQKDNAHTVLKRCTIQKGSTLNQVKCAITQESVKYQNKILTEMLFSQL